MTSDPKADEPTSTEPLPNDITQCSSRVDDIDRQIVELLISRFRLSRHIGTLKSQLGAEPFDPRRIRQQTASFIGLCVKGGLGEMMATSLIQAILHQVVSERLERNAPQD